MTSPNRDRAERDFVNSATNRMPDYIHHTDAVRVLTSAYDELSTALADRDRYKDALAASEVRNFELAANQCEAGYGGVGGSHRCRYQDDSREAWNEGVREALDIADGGIQSMEDVFKLRDRIHKEILSLLTQPDRSAARQKVIDLATKTVTVAGPDPRCDCLHCRLSRAVQELQSPNKEENVT